MNRRAFFARIFGSVASVPVVNQEGFWNKLFGWVNGFLSRPSVAIVNDLPPKLGGDDCAAFRRISMPLVRRIYPGLIVDKMFDVQPLESKVIYDKPERDGRIDC